MKKHRKPITGIAVKKYLLAIKKVFQCNTLKTLLYGRNKRRVFFTALVGLAILVAGTALWYQHRRPSPDTSYKLPAGTQTNGQSAQAPLKETPTVPTPASGDTERGGHWHGDEWHADKGANEGTSFEEEGTSFASGSSMDYIEGSSLSAEPHDAHDTGEQAPQTAPAAPNKTPFAHFKPEKNLDPVATAYKRLDYIANNLHEWGPFSPRTLELIDELTPVPDWIEGEGLREMELLTELSELRDPRSAELLVSYEMDSGIMGRPPYEALIAMGPASVPPLVARLDDLSGESYLILPIRLLLQIMAAHRSDLGGIVEHIIIPKLEAIAASTTTYQYYANKVLAQLRQ